MKIEDWTITTSYGVLEAVSIISRILGEQCMVDNKKAGWYDYEYISIDFHKLPGDILFDLDSPEMDEDIIDRIIFDLSLLDICFKLKLNDVVYSYDEFEEAIDCIEDFRTQV